MACINPDGTLSPTAKKVLRSIEEPLSLPEVSEMALIPVFMLRSSMRELIAASYVMELDGKYQITEKGKEKI